MNPIISQIYMKSDNSAQIQKLKEKYKF